MRTVPGFVIETNLSVAWAKAFLAVMRPGVRGLAPLVIHVTGLRDAGPPELADIRRCLDETLSGLGQRQVETVANTIFPDHFWRRSGGDRGALYDKYLRVLPRLKRIPISRDALYSER